MTTPDHISPDSAKFLSSEQCYSVSSSGISTIEHANGIYGQRVRRMILAPRNFQAFNAALQEKSRLNHQNYSEYVEPAQVKIFE